MPEAQCRGAETRIALKGHRDTGMLQDWGRTGWVGRASRHPLPPWVGRELRPGQQGHIRVISLSNSSFHRIHLFLWGMAAGGLLLPSLGRCREQGSM